MYNLNECNACLCNSGVVYNRILRPMTYIWFFATDLQSIKETILHPLFAVSFVILLQFVCLQGNVFFSLFYKWLIVIYTAHCRFWFLKLYTLFKIVYAFFRYRRTRVILYEFRGLSTNLVKYKVESETISNIIYKAHLCFNYICIA